ncbi:hypothetical protein EDB81DRAFT_865368 [Dactylonectria macrodidyma]|uniref:Hemerythrin-like domain-containing protein n=1 Tax=Dactylonectria macrodidyma TaxID=307937 RepID=A0A9P9FJ73_9HYPO|nr:hypothetical protein EDB81DRAFT_865368 [Dactylonectria macrodidyma]
MGSSTPKQRADTPLSLIHTPIFLTKKTDMWTEGASHMANLHNAIFRGYNSIYQQAPHVKVADKSDFLGYCKTWCKFVKTHAAEEERKLFPMAEDLLREEVFKHTHEEHDAFVPALGDFAHYLDSLESPQDLSSERMLELMRAFQQPFEDHFRSEIDTIAALASHSNSPELGSKEYIASKARFDKWGQSSVLTGGVTDVAMFLLFNLDRDFEDGLWKNWPEVPGPVRWVGSRVVGRWHGGWWKFASCDADGKRKELYALS